VIGEDRKDILIQRQLSGLSESTPGISEDVLVVPASCSAFFDCTADVEVRIPRQLPVSVSINQGSVRFLETAGDISVEVGNGMVEGHGLAGPVFRAQAGMGSVDVDFDQIPSGVYIGTGIGDVEVELPSSSYRLELAGLSGVSVEGIVEGKKPDLPEVSVRTASGQVVVRGVVD
jgi:hypothetical protein